MGRHRIGVMRLLAEVRLAATLRPARRLVGLAVALGAVVSAVTVVGVVPQSDDQHDGTGKAAASPSPSLPPYDWGVIGSLSPSPSASGSPGASAQPSASGSPSRVAPPPAAAPPPATRTTGPAAPRPRSVSSYEAEDNRMSGETRPGGCTGCSSGWKVRYIGNCPANSLTFRGVDVATAGTYQLAIDYLVLGSRSLTVTVNGGRAGAIALSGNSWDTPARVTVTVNLRAGTNSVTFSNDNYWAPDIDKIAIG